MLAVGVGVNALMNHLSFTPIISVLGCFDAQLLLTGFNFNPSMDK